MSFNEASLTAILIGDIMRVASLASSQRPTIAANVVLIKIG